MGLLTKIFGNSEGGASASTESSASEQPSGAAASAEDPVISAYPKGDANSSGIRPAVEAPAQRSREATRPASGTRRPEHPRMYLRPSPATVDPALPGSTRRPQISVRPGARETNNRAAPPPSKRAASERARSELMQHRERTSDPNATAPGALPGGVVLPGAPLAGTPSNTLPPASRPKNALVVSPVSLTPEQVELPPGTRPKMPTLLGLGAALETPPLPLVAPSANAGRSGTSRTGVSGDVASSAVASSGVASSGSVSSGVASSGVATSASAVASPGAGHLVTNPGAVGPGATRAPSPFDALALPVDVEAPHDIGAQAQLLADFALKLSLGPVSHLWVPEARRSAEALLLTGKQRHETALAALCARLLALLPDEHPALEEPPLETDAALDAAPTLEAALTLAPSSSTAGAPCQPIDGTWRDQILHEVSRLAGVLPEWPAPAQDLAEEARRRETRIMRELLTVVDGFKRDQRARLEQQMRLEELALMSAASIAEEFEAPLERATELRQVLNAYRAERQARAPDVDNVITIGVAIEGLTLKSREFDDCDPERKELLRLLRVERRRALTTVNLLLAERGELEWLEQLEPLAINERAERLAQWYESARFESARPDGARADGNARGGNPNEGTEFDGNWNGGTGFGSGWFELGQLESGGERVR